MADNNFTTNGEIRAIFKIGTIVYVGGTFTLVGNRNGNALVANNIAKYDILSNTWSALTYSTNGVNGTIYNGINSGVYTIYGLSNTAIFIGGRFSGNQFASGLIVNNIAKWNDNAGVLSAITYDLNGTNGTLYNGFSASVFTIYGLSNTAIFIGGQFSGNQFASGLITNYIAKWNDDTGVLSAIIYGINGTSYTYGTPYNGFSSNVNTIYGLHNNAIFIGGRFSGNQNGSGLTANYIAKWNNDTGVLSAITYGTYGKNGAQYNGFNTVVYTIYGLRNTAIFIGGNFSGNQRTSGLIANRIAKWNDDTGVLSAITYGANGASYTNGSRYNGFNSSVNVIYGLSDTSIFMGGQFSGNQNASGLTARQIVSQNGMITQVYCRRVHWDHYRLCML